MFLKHMFTVLAEPAGREILVQLFLSAVQKKEQN